MLDRPVGLRARLDPERMRQALGNLINNAAQALQSQDLPEGERREIRIRAREDEGSLEITVADNGPGIAEEEREQVFEPLFSTRSFGVGLGLPLVKRIVEQHEGTLSLQEAPSGGAEFVVRLPMDPRLQGAG